MATPRTPRLTNAPRTQQNNNEPKVIAILTDRPHPARIMKLWISVRKTGPRSSVPTVRTSDTTSTTSTPPADGSVSGDESAALVAPIAGSTPTVESVDIVLDSQEETPVLGAQDEGTWLVREKKFIEGEAMDEDDSWAVQARRAGRIRREEETVDAEADRKIGEEADDKRRGWEDGQVENES